MNVWLSRRRVGTTLMLATVACLIWTGLAPSTAGARVPSVKRIENLAKNAYIWGLAPEFVYRFEKYNDLVTAKRNTLGGGGGVAAAWNNNATNAGDASVLYLNSMMDLSGKKGRGRTKELVLTVPPSANDYYVVNLLDDFINSVGSIGTRTTPSTTPQTYLIAGPTSRYAHRRTVQIHGFRYRVMATDTDLNWMLIRIRADSLVPPSDPASTASIQTNVVERFGMTTLRRFEARGHRPKYFEPNQYTPTDKQKQRAQHWHNAPQDAVAFLKQLGQSLKLNPLPTARTGLNGIPLNTLPDWVVPQAGARTVFRNPAFGQKHTLARFKPIGLTANGFRIPRHWRQKQLTALQNGFLAGNTKLTDKLSTAGAVRKTNYWSYLNANVGTYPNTHQGYLYRGIIVLEGGSANMPQDAVYAQINNLNGQSSTQLKGDNTYKLTFKPPHSGTVDLPAIGSLPPTVNDSSGNPKGFWSIHVYQTDTSESAAPFLTQPSVLNTSYSSANLDVTAVDPSTDTLTVRLPPTPWGPLLASTPVLFGPTAAQYGLTPNTPYYIVEDATSNADGTYSFQVSTLWRQDVSSGDVPIQGTDPGQYGGPGPIVPLQDPGGTVNLQWGPIQPVSQLGSQQLTSGRLARNPDGSVTIWIAPTLPAGAPATNWIPTPSAAYYESIYQDDQDPDIKQPMPTSIRPLIRMYYPTPGNTPPSILPPPNGPLQATYVFPKLEQVNAPAP
ncbi:DUF1254 domain-containing protein [Capillimicrobium parvum]|uniref:Uncharacterized protein n=1 Tax=Capillimicrobium parvum TaxID=2884022 RepID=A0A9E7C2F3_9ACTN|nr:DUF1254 domain-containing protein [Capillimicrobium parvum]UGS38386.1 hypothetical protein DSM104329_04810 [Capillimicrobium parvum]